MRAKKQGQAVWRGTASVMATLLIMGGLPGCHPAPPPLPPPTAPARVICASPALAEIVFALGAGHLVVGVADFTDWPPEAAALPRIGGALAPSRERILTLAPDLLLAQGKAEALAGLARAHRIPIVALPLDTLADLRAAVTRLAGLLGVDDNGRALLAGMDAGFAALAPQEIRPVFIALGHTPGDLSGLITSGRGTFLDDILTRAGGSNIFADLAQPWPRVSREALLQRAPDLVLDIQAHPLDAPRRAALATDWQRLGFAPAQIRILEEPFLLRPGPRAHQAAARLAAALQSTHDP